MSHFAYKPRAVGGFRFWRQTMLSLVCVFAAGLQTGCSTNDKENADSNPSRQMLKMTIGASPETLDPHRLTGVPGHKVLAALSEPLLVMDYNSFEVEPGVAERWQQSEDGLVYQFFLREQARWSNGDPVTATDFVYAFKRILSPRLGNQYVTDYFAIKNAEAYYKGELEDFAKVGVTALTDHILQITLSRYDPLFLKRVAQRNTSPVHWKSILEYGDIDDPANPWTDPGKYISNGPFILTDWQLNKEIVAEKNPHYWDASSILLDMIEFNLADTESVEERLFRSGQIDLAFSGRIPVEKIARYRKESPELLFTKTIYGTYFYLFNTQKAPFDNHKVRMALSMAVDRQLLIDTILKNDEQVALALSPPTPRYVAPSQPGFNPARARELLAEAGYADGKGLPQFGLIYNTSDAHRKIAVAIQQMWAKELNLSVQLENQEWKVFLDNRQQLNYDVARAGSLSTFGDPLDLLTSLTTGHGMNDSGWSNREFDALIRQAENEVDEERRMQIMAQAEALMLDQAPVMPLFYYNTSYLKYPRVKGFEFNRGDLPDFKGVYLEVASQQP